jgi:glycosyltransferase involved in cell wall biosynthesis
MRILHIYKDYYPPIVGGMEMFMALLCREMKGRADVEALVCSRSLRSRVRSVDGVRVTEVGELFRILSAPIAPAFPLFLKRARHDILHFHLPNPTAVMSYLITRPPGRVVVQYQSDIVRQAFALKTYGRFLRKFLGLADAIIVSSPNYLETSDHLAPFKEKCRIIPLGIDLDEFELKETEQNAARALQEKYGGRFLLFVGVLRYYKGVDYLLEAMQQVDCPLVVVGDGPERQTLESKRAALGLEDKVHFTGQIEQRDLVQHLHACETFVFPASHRSEAYGISLVQALACSKPAVSTRLGTGTSFVNLDGETGIVVEPRDPGALADAINRLLGDDELRRRLGANGTERARTLFSKERTVDEIWNLYQQLAIGGLDR